MLIYSYNFNCSDSLINASLKQHGDDKVSFLGQEYLLMLWIVPLSIVAGLVNAFSLLIFLRQRFENKAVLFNLVSISASEVLLQSSVLTEAGLVLGRIEHRHTHWSSVITTLGHVYINTCFSIRNWNVVLLAVSRCELVRMPLSARTQRLVFSRRRLLMSEIGIVLLSLVLSCIHNLKEQGFVCENYNDIVLVSPLLTIYPLYQYYELYGIFMYQCCLPVLIIAAATLATYCKLREQTHNHRSPTPRAGSDILPVASMLAPAASSSTSGALLTTTTTYSSLHRSSRHSLTMGSRQRTSYFILALSCLFCLLQLPTFVVTVILLCVNDTTFFIHPDLFTNTLSVLDSLLNFFVYAASSHNFRRRARTLLASLNPIRRTAAAAANNNTTRGAGAHTAVVAVPSRSFLSSRGCVGRFAHPLHPHRQVKAPIPVVHVTYDYSDEEVNEAHVCEHEQ